jgi:hypothetical protein
MDRFSPSRLVSVAALGLLLMGLGAVHPASAQETDIQTADYDVTELTYPDLRDFEVPEPERVELDNGMIVFLLEDPELPQVTPPPRSGWAPSTNPLRSGASPPLRAPSCAPAEPNR